MTLPRGSEITRQAGHPADSQDLVECGVNYKNATHPQFMVGAFVRQGAWLDWTTPACKEATPSGGWIGAQPPSMLKHYRNGYGAWVTELKGADFSYGLGRSEGGSSGLATCPTDFYVRGFDATLAAENNSVARVTFRCLNPRTGATATAEVPYAPQPQGGLTYRSVAGSNCDKGWLATGIVGTFSQNIPSIGGLLVGSSASNVIHSIGLVCRPYRFLPGNAVGTFGQGQQSPSAPVAHDQFIGTFDTTPAGYEPIFLYTVRGNGDLMWSMLDSTASASSGPKKVGDKWQVFADIIPGRRGEFFALTPEGYLQWYQHIGYATGRYQWAKPVQVGQGFQLAKFFAGGDGIIYAIRPDGELVWYKPELFRAGHGEQDNFWAGAKAIGTDWAQFKTVFSMGKGVIYAVKHDGTLLWYRHDGYQDGARAWSGPVEVGSGWAQFKDIVPVGNGIMLAVRPDGTLLWYRHKRWENAVAASGRRGVRGFVTTALAWEGPTTIGSGLADYRKIFALMPQVEASPVR